MKWNENLHKKSDKLFFGYPKVVVQYRVLNFNSRPVIFKIDFKIVNFKFC